MYNTTLINLAILLGLMPVAILSTWGILRGLDHISGQSFKRVILPDIERSSTVGVYYGLRFFGACYLVAQLTNRFV